MFKEQVQRSKYKEQMQKVGLRSKYNEQMPGGSLRTIFKEQVYREVLSIRYKE